MNPILKISMKNSNHKKMPPSSRVDARNHFPTFLDGMASVIDIHGLIFKYYVEKISKISDYTALRSDWEMVGQDIRQIVSQIEKDLGQELQKPLKDAPSKALEEAFEKIVGKKTQDERANAPVPKD
jgi:hypothetical protein